MCLFRIIWHNWKYLHMMIITSWQSRTCSRAPSQLPQTHCLGPRSWRYWLTVAKITNWVLEYYRIDHSKSLAMMKMNLWSKHHGSVVVRASSTFRALETSLSRTTWSMSSCSSLFLAFLLFLSRLFLSFSLSQPFSLSLVLTHLSCEFHTSSFPLMWKMLLHVKRIPYDNGNLPVSLSPQGMPKI